VANRSSSLYGVLDTYAGAMKAKEDQLVLNPS